MQPVVRVAEILSPELKSVGYYG